MKERRSSNVAVATLLTLLTLAVLAMSSITVSASTEKVIKGDLNADSNVNCFDMVLMKRAILGSYDPDLERADLNSDGTVSIADAVMLNRFVIGTISNFETTTTAVTANSTTTTTTTATTSTPTTTTTWTPPKRESLIHDGETMDEETYELLNSTAKMFGIKRYEFQWSIHPVEYGIIDPGPLFCMTEGFAYGYGCQVLPSDKIDVFAPEKSKLERGEFKSKYDFLLYRPLLSDDNDSRVLESFEQTEDALKTEEFLISGMNKIIESPNYEPGEDGYEVEIKSYNEHNPVDFVGWYLVPIDENGEKIEKIPSSFDTAIEPAKSIKYWFANDQLRSAGFIIERPVFNIYIETAYAYNMQNFKLVYNKDVENPILYSFEKGGTSEDSGIKLGAPQVVPYYELPKMVDLHKFCLEYAGGSEKAATEFENQILEGNHRLYYYVTLSEYDRNNKCLYIPDPYVDRHDLYVLIPLDEEGNEDLRPYPINID